MDILKEIIYEQNRELLGRIANDKYNHDIDKNEFIGKYLKKNFSHLNVVKRDPTPKYVKKLIRCVK
jgi:hypothetical protein